MFNRIDVGGVWSAAPTPFTDDWKLDEKSICRLAEHQINLGVKGVFIGGTCGEGPWLTQLMLRELCQLTSRAIMRRIPIAVQVTDNSASRMIDNIKRVADSGVDIVVIAPPFFQMKPTQNYLRKLYLEVVENSPLPVGLYHRGKHSSVLVSHETLIEVAKHEKVVMIKDSSADDDAKVAFLNFKRNLHERDFLLLNGNEFDCVPYLKDGYDGLLLGGACFNGAIAKKIYDLTRNGKLDEAGKVQARMNELMYQIFGGKDCSCWLAGQKQMMVELGVFSTSRTIINYEVSAECGETIKSAFHKYKSELLP